MYAFFCSFSIALVKFANRPDDTFLIVGIAKDLVLNPRSINGGELLTYQVDSNLILFFIFFVFYGVCILFM